MATVSNYLFDNMTRIGEDECGLSQQNIQNSNAGNYMLTSFGAANCGMGAPITMATSQPGINYSGSHQVGIGGCNIDQNSELLINSQGNRTACKLSLSERPFSTVPYMGRGPVNPEVESQLQQSESNVNKKSANTISDQSFIDYTYYPLIPSIQSTVQNPSNLVEEAAAEGWIRGGLPSRDIKRDTQYFNSHKQ
jgi:hypothetical protein